MTRRPLIGAILFLALAGNLPAFAQTASEVVEYRFQGVDGKTPIASLLQASDGNLYGITLDGGPNNVGTVFKLSGPAGARTKTVIHAFTGREDGGYPNGSLIQASDGNLYGTTFGGGASAGGTVFKISNLAAVPVESVVYSFTGGADGGGPEASLVQGVDRNLYGTTVFGGLDLCAISGSGCGTVFEISDLSGNPRERVVYSFLGANDGSLPRAPVIQASDGNLYGTTTQGGLSNCPTFQQNTIGCGTVFRISNLRGTPVETVIYRFTDSTDGAEPLTALLQASDGNLYGTLGRGGNNNNGLVYKIANLSSTPDFHIVYAFAGGVDGNSPAASLIEASDGYLYGTTFSGGSRGAGTVYRIGNFLGGPVESTVYSFLGGSDGGNPVGPLIQAADRRLYGTTISGGFLNLDYGTVFSLDIGAPGPPAPCVPSALTLCIDDHPGDRRFQIQAVYQTSQGGGASGTAHAIPLAAVGLARGGAFWFFSPDNPELLVKILDGCQINGNKWFFASAATNVGFVATVTDTKNGAQTAYTSLDLSPGLPVQDTVLARCSIVSDTLLAKPEPVAKESTPKIAAPVIFGCTPGDATLCIDGSPGDRRFKVEVAYQTSQGGGGSGEGHAVPLAPVGITHGGAFWFFSPDNPEMLVKVLDGCAINGQKWFFASAGTNVGYTLTLTDMATGQQKIYTNDDLHAADPILDTAAFATCP